MDKDKTYEFELKYNSLLSTAINIAVLSFYSQIIQIKKVKIEVLISRLKMYVMICYFIH